MRSHALVVFAVTLALAGCGSTASGSSSGSATIWVTQDRGASVLDDAHVPAGQTLLRGLRSAADVETRYGGRFVQSIDGVEGNASAHRDWFWFVNGLLGDRSAAEYRLHDGDVAWWDYRDWGKDYDVEVVVGVFPEPFLHGFGGHVHPSAVRYAPSLRSGAEKVAALLHARSVATLGTPVASDANVLELVTGSHRFTAALRRPGTGPEGAVIFTYSGNVANLLPGGKKPFIRAFSVP